MKSRTFCFIAVFVGYAALTFSAIATPAAVTEAPTSEEQKILLDCQHSDYRTYIKCLKRQKRHHFQHGDTHPDFDHNCLESCMKKCETEHDDCDKKCSHCLRKTKHKHQIITEYETECVSGDCTNNSNNNNNNDLLRSTNITTKIDIHNIISNGSGICCPTCQPPIPCTPPHPPYPPYPQPPQPPQPPRPPHVYPPRPPVQPSYPSYLPFPLQLALVPQVSLGLGLSMGSGCAYPNQWPCVYPGWTDQGGQIDCSGCGSVHSQYRCDVSCYVSGVQPTTNPTPCTSPYCVGGSQG